MRISDWSSDVCSSDLKIRKHPLIPCWADEQPRGATAIRRISQRRSYRRDVEHLVFATDRKSVVSGKSVSVRVDLGGRRIIKKNKRKHESRTQFAQYLKQMTSFTRYTKIITTTL